ncbi:hypothetical protein PENTCL1PPCAC_18726, partial [Pristionchus entomophagus]
MFSQKRKTDSDIPEDQKKPMPVTESDLTSWNEHHYSAQRAVTDNEYNKTKWDGVLKVFQIEKGFSVIFYVCDDEHPARVGKPQHNRVIGYRYDIELNADGEFTEKRTTVDKYLDGSSFHHLFMLPDRLFNAISEIMQRYQS